MRLLGRRPLCLVALSLGAGCAPGPRLPEWVPEQAARSVLLPARFGWVSSERSSATLPSAIALGGRADGRVLVYLEFPGLEQPRRLLRAELLLSPGAPPADAVQIELSRAEPARGELQQWGDQPAARYPRVARTLELTSSSPIALDVTELLRAQAAPGEPLCLLLHAEPGRGAGFLLETGAAGGRAPRLEAYFE